MNEISVLYQMGLADFRERTRRYSFLVTMLGVLFFGYLVITGQYTVQFGDCRPVYDSVWAGTLMAVCSSIMLTLVGFYLVKGSIGRDRKTEVGQIVAATPISRTTYIVSKLVSNTAVLLFMAIVLALVAFITLLFRNEASGIDLWAFLVPFAVIVFPATVFVASVAVLFDCIRWLRGSAGNIIYLFLAEFCIVFGMLNAPLLDLGAVSAFTDSARAAASAAFEGEKIGLLMGFVKFDPAMRPEVFRIFEWNGIEWTAGALLLRVFWLGAAVIVAGIAVPLFDRFDPAVGRVKKARKKKKARIAESGTESHETGSVISYESLSRPLMKFRLPTMVVAELRLALRGRHWFWYAAAIGLSVAQLAAPYSVARMYLIPGAMIWPLLIWSSMGNRDSIHNTAPLLFSSPEPLKRQFPAVWLSGLIVALAAVSFMAIRALIVGDWSYVATLLVAAFFVPSVSLALGTLSGGKKLFEVLYLMIWYVGSVDHLHAVDLLGTTDEAIAAGKLVALVLLTLASLMAAFSARRVQLMQG